MPLLQKLAFLAQTSVSFMISTTTYPLTLSITPFMTHTIPLLLFTILDIKYDLRFSFLHLKSSLTSFQTSKIIFTVFTPQYSKALGQVWAEMARSLSSSVIIPFHTSNYSTFISQNFEKFTKKVDRIIKKYNIELGKFMLPITYFIIIKCLDKFLVLQNTSSMHFPLFPLFLKFDCFSPG